MLDHLFNALHETPGPLARRDAAEDAWEARFIEAELDCTHCDGYGWNIGVLGFRKCTDCQGGSIYTELCVRCNKPESGRKECSCSVGDFMAALGQQ